MSTVTTVTAPEALDPEDARNTLTYIATVGVHRITGRVQPMYFSSPRELEDHLGQRDNRATNTVFDLDRVTGEWVERTV